MAQPRKELIVTLPVRTLHAQPNLDQLKRQAKELLETFRAGNAEAAAEVLAHYGGADAATFALHDAQLVLARSYGFGSWPKLKAYVDGATITRLTDAVRAGNVARVRAMLHARPELVNMAMAENDERRALHLAVLDRAPAMVRLLMERGADARTGIYPHRGATTALAIATERGYDEIAAIIKEEEQRRSGSRTAVVVSPSTVAPTGGDAAAAVRRGDAGWLRTRHAAGALINTIDDSGGLLTLAVTHDRPDMLALLLDLGFDPNERTRLEDVEQIVYSAGFPLWRCAALGRYAMAEILLTRGANPNVHVYASGSPVYSAYRHRQPEMVALLKRYGGVVGADIAGLYRETELARQMLADEARDGGPLPEGVVSPGRTLAEELLDFGSCGGDPEIVRMALERIDWPRGDPRWFWMLGRSLESDADGGAHLECFRQVLERSGPHMIGRFGRTMLHEMAAQRNPVTSEEAAAFARLLLEAGAATNLRDDLLKSTPLGWACRWGHVEIVQRLLERGADPIEADAEPWATPRAWAEKMGHAEISELLLAEIKRIDL
jgi:ankyrin repeat protein